MPFLIMASLAALPAALAAFALTLINPWFLDRPMLYAGLFMVIPALTGVTLGFLPMARRIPGGTVWPALVFGLFVSAWAWPEPKIEGVDVLVVGVDGATFEVIDPMVEAGELPAFGRMRAGGSRAVLRSMEPMFSPLLWTTMAAGKPPEQHGIHGFHVHADDCQIPRFWDVAEAEGKRVGIYKWLVSWPPRELDGFIVPAWLAPGPETFPAELSFIKELELSRRLKRKKVEATRSSVELVLAGIPRGLRFGTLWDAFSWTLRERAARPDEDERNYTLQLLRGRMDRDVFVYALSEHQPELATFTYYATDALSHRFWTYHEPEAFADVDARKLKQYGGAVQDAYRGADEILGELLDRVGPDTTVLIVSDHGFQALKDVDGKSFFAPSTKRLQARLTEAVGPVDISKMGVKLSVGAKEGVDLGALEAAILALTDAEGRPFYRVEPVPDNSRALGLTLADEDVDAERIAQDTVGGEPMSDYVTLTEGYSGIHRDDGVFYALGPGVPGGQDMPDAHLLDVAPTIQALLGVAPAQDLEGQILFGADARGPASRDALAATLFPDSGEGGGEAEVNEEQLRALGYVE